VVDYVHKSIMVTEVLSALQPDPSGVYFDGTIGGGGHALAILKASAPNGWLTGCDRDGVALKAAERRLAKYVGRFALRQGNYAEMDKWMKAESCHGVLLDLGVSSPQLDIPARGFSFMQDGPLDMRQDQRQSLSAKEVLNEFGQAEVAQIFWEFGGERRSRRMAAMIIREREKTEIVTTRQLAGLIEKHFPRAGRKTHPATKIFQAIRMVVNQELDSLQQGLKAAVKILRPGGRLAVITFNSTEDRCVKSFVREMEKDYAVVGAVDVPELRQPRPAILRRINRRALSPSIEEVKSNPRARSAQLRVMEKL
jgi:16S rRNA (cytosine1402-N4)-methyltransferase